MDSILSFDNGFKTFDAFIEFLAINGIGEEKLIENIKKSKIDCGSDGIYCVLSKYIESFLKYMAVNDVSEPAKNAEYILNYLHVVYYRAAERDFYLSPQKKQAYGITHERAYHYMTGHGGYGLIHYFQQFCLSKNIPIAFLNGDGGDFFFSITADSKEADKIIQNLNDDDFAELYKSFEHSEGFLDYRLYAYLFVNLLDEIETIKGRLTSSARAFLEPGILNLRKPILDIAKSPTKIGFHEYIKISGTAWTLTFSVHKKFHEIEEELGSRGKSLIDDLLSFGNIIGRLKASIDAILDMGQVYGIIREDQPAFDFNHFESLLNNEQERRENERLNKIREEMGRVDPKEVKDLAIRFLKLGQYDENGNQNDLYPSFGQFSLNNKADYEDLYRKLSKDKEVLELVAGAQKEYENTVFSNLIAHDYSKLTFIPCKLIERMLKTEIYNRHKPEMNDIISGKTKFNDSGRFKNVKTSQTDFADGKTYPRNPYSMELGPTEKALQEILGKDIPWFMNKTTENDKSYFYTEFTSKMRNSKFHVGIITDILEAKENYRKVAYWFVEVLSAFDPFI